MDTRWFGPQTYYGGEGMKVNIEFRPYDGYYFIAGNGEKFKINRNYKLKTSNEHDEMLLIHRTVDIRDHGATCEVSDIEAYDLKLLCKINRGILLSTEYEIIHEERNQ